MDIDISAYDHVDDMYIDISLTPSTSYTGYNFYTGVYGNSRIELRFRVQCKPDYYGDDCTRYCVGNEDQYTCDHDGTRVCLPGWTDSECSIRECVCVCLGTLLFS